MRRVLFIFLVVSCLAVPAAGATLARTAGGVYVQFMDGAGAVTVRYRGNFFGSVKQGRILATRNVIVSGWRTKRTLPSGLIEYRGPNQAHDHMGFRTPASPALWRIRLGGVGISATGFVRGCLTLDGVNVGRTGLYRIRQEGAVRPWPRKAWTRSLPLGLSC